MSKHLHSTGDRDDPLRLQRHFAPREAKPCQVSTEFIGQFGSAPRTVDILDPQQHFTAVSRRPIMRDDRRISVAEVQRPVRAGGEARAYHATVLAHRSEKPNGRQPGQVREGSRWSFSVERGGEHQPAETSGDDERQHANGKVAHGCPPVESPSQAGTPPRA